MTEKRYGKRTSWKLARSEGYSLDHAAAPGISSIGSLHFSFVVIQVFLYRFNDDFGTLDIKCPSAFQDEIHEPVVQILAEIDLDSRHISSFGRGSINN
jgi:hypothetical protein